jgi:hypothetical protein
VAPTLINICFHCLVSLIAKKVAHATLLATRQ